MNSGFRFVCPNKNRGKQFREKTIQVLKIISENSNNGIPNRRDRKNKPVPKIGTLLVLTT
jgi:hypothetical protein